MECKTCFGEGGITADNFGDVQSFQCPDCNGTGTVEEDIAEFKEITKESFKVWSDFWSDDECLKNVVHQFGVESLKKDVLFYIRAIEHFKSRMETAERQRDEAIKAGLEQSIQHLKEIEESNENLEKILVNVERMANDLTEAIKALEWYGVEKNYEKKSDIPELAMVSAAWMDYGKLARTTIKRIKEDSQAEGHLSTESAQAQAGGRKESGGSYE